MDYSSQVSVELSKREGEPDWMATQPRWVACFRYLRYSLKSADTRKVFDLLYELIKDESTTYRIFRLIGLVQGLAAIMEYFAGYSHKGQGWRGIHTSEAVEGMLKEIQSCRRKSLE